MGSDPATWVLADCSAAIVLLVFAFGRTGIAARLMSTAILLGSVFIAFRMVSDGFIWPPMLLVVYSLRGWRISRASWNGAMEEVSRVLVCAMAAGIPAGILANFVDWRPWGRHDHGAPLLPAFRRPPPVPALREWLYEDH